MTLAGAGNSLNPPGGELSAHPSGLPPSLCGRRGLARQEEPQADVEVSVKGFLRFSQEETHTCSTHPSLLPGVSPTVPHFWPSLQAGPKTPVISNLLPLAHLRPSSWNALSGPLLPGEFLSILQIQASNILSSVTLPDPLRQGPQDGRGQVSPAYFAQCPPVRPGSQKGKAG